MKDINYNYICNDVLDNINFLGQVIECIEDKTNETTKLLTIKALEECQERYKDRIKIKEGGKGLRPSLLNRYDDNILAEQLDLIIKNRK